MVRLMATAFIETACSKRRARLDQEQKKRSPGTGRPILYLKSLMEMKMVVRKMPVGQGKEQNSAGCSAWEKNMALEGSKAHTSFTAPSAPYLQPARLQVARGSVRRICVNLEMHKKKR